MTEEETTEQPEEPRPSEEETSKKGLGEFVTVSMRGPKRGIYEQLLAQLLIKGNRTNNDLIKIMSVCEAALMSRQKDKLDMNHVDVCYAVCRSFLNTRPDPNIKNVVRVAWSFPQTEENWKLNIEPWKKTNLSYSTLQTNWRHRNYPEKKRYGECLSPWKQTERENEILDYLDALAEKINIEISQLPPHQAFFEVTSALTEQSFAILQGEFTGWALRQLSQIKAQIAEEISPQVWREALGVFGEEQEEE